jgi:hypothetical protein
MPLEPATSKIIADAVTQTIKDIDRIVNDLTASAASREELVDRIKTFETRLANFLDKSRNEGSIVIWSKEFIMRLARICALATFNLDKRRAKALMMPIAKLRNFMPPFNPCVKSLVEMMYSLISKVTATDEPLKMSEVEKLFEEFLS